MKFATGERKSVSGLVRSILSVRPLVDVLQQPIRIVDFKDTDTFELTTTSRAHQPECEEALNLITRRIGAPALTLNHGLQVTDTTILERVVSARVNVQSIRAPIWGQIIKQKDDLDPIIEQSIATEFEGQTTMRKVPSFDGTNVQTYSVGHPGRTTIVIASACGMPAKLCARWMEVLGRESFVVTWESRGLFGTTERFDDLEYDAIAQARDLGSILDYFMIRDAHVMGFCGGAIVALTAAATLGKARIRSLSLWHGDFELGSSCPKTLHQHNLKCLLDTAAAGRHQATTLYTLFSRSTRVDVPEDISHIVLYPFGNAELLFRYGRVNGSIMNTDVRHLLDSVQQPALVVTSQDDTTAHPSGSRAVAEALPCASLHVEEHGDHLSVFKPTSLLTRVASSFIASVHADTNA